MPSSMLIQRMRQGWVALALSGCGLLAQAEDELARKAIDSAKVMQSGPDRNVTSFDPALRCMDRLFVTYGIRGVPFLIEEIPDATKKVNVGAREMFISATSRMTQRSGAIRLIPFQPSIVLQNRQDFVDNARYVLQGSVTQLDESLVRRQRDGSICLGPVCLGAADSDTYNAMGLDMNVIRTSDFSLLPGVSSKNSVLIVKRGVGADGEMNMKKLGLSFNFSMSRSEGNGQALRALIELGAIELYGRLLKIPYWSCLGQSDKQEEVRTEIDDWWESMAADTPQLVTWLQTQMLARKLYAGEANGVADEPLLRAVAAYKGAMGMKADEELDVGFFKAYLAADHAKLEAVARQRVGAVPPAVAAPASPAMPAPAATVAAAEAAATPPAVAASALLIRERATQKVGQVSLDRGAVYELDVVPARSGYLYCWLYDDQKKLNLFFPNPSQRQAQVRGGSTLAVPGNMGFKLTVSKSGLTETVACALSDKDLGFDPLAQAAKPVRDLLALRNQLILSAGPGVSLSALDVNGH